LAAKRRREEKKMSKEEGWAVCGLERIADFDLEIEISAPLFVDTARKWSGLLTDTFWGTDCVRKGEEFTENPLVKAEVIRYRLILALIQHECIPVAVADTPLMDDLLVQHLSQN
jgi:hypothetical protein